jgi:hypothetical protein
MKKETIYLIILILVILIAGGYFLFFYKKPTKPTFIFPKIPVTLQEKIKEDFIKNAPIKSGTTSADVFAVDLSRKNTDGFVITYLKKEDLFKVDLVGKDLEKEKKAAEEYLLNNVFRTRDPNIVCSIKVRFVDISAPLAVSEFLAKNMPKDRPLSKEEKDKLYKEAEKIFQAKGGGVKIVSEKLSICP